ncbi:hypothetical protein PG984_002998 [Apiospora sp. TS-2023a]
MATLLRIYSVEKIMVFWAIVLAVGCFLVWLYGFVKRWVLAFALGRAIAAKLHLFPAADIIEAGETAEKKNKKKAKKAKKAEEEKMRALRRRLDEHFSAPREAARAWATGQIPGFRPPGAAPQG